MDYSKLSDFEINKLVAAALNINVEETMAFSNGGEDIKTHSSGLVLMKKITEHKKFWREFDPCNNPADAWPIIIDNRISIYAPLGDGLWVADYSFEDEEGELDESKVAIDNNSNPLRAAMVAYLMMRSYE